MTTSILIALVARLGFAPAPVTGPTCLPADSNSTHYAERIASIVSDNDSTAQLLRTRLKLPQLSASNISLVTDSRSCSNASTALDATQGLTNATRRMYLFKLGTSRFGVVDLTALGSTTDFTDAPIPIWYFDSKWNLLSAGTT